MGQTGRRRLVKIGAACLLCLSSVVASHIKRQTLEDTRRVLSSIAHLFPPLSPPPPDLPHEAVAYRKRAGPCPLGPRPAHLRWMHAADNRHRVPGGADGELPRALHPDARSAGGPSSLQGAFPGIHEHLSDLSVDGVIV